jgi:superfamily II DNA/RNA helicase
MILMQRLVVSSTRAIRMTLERRLEALRAPQEQLTLFPSYSEEDWVEMDGQEQMETLLKTRLKALKNEKAEVELLLDAASRCAQGNPDAKAEALLEWIYRLQQEEGDADLKVLLFTEFVPTQDMLAEFLSERGFAVVRLNGSMDMDERRRVQEAFARDARILVSTDAGGEGLNLQFSHVVVNYDIPWNPMRLEQRIGRVDRIGQTHEVRALNLVLEDSVEHRVREVLEEKLAVIFQEFGVDKTGDVLDSADAERWFDDVFVEAILHPERLDDSIEGLVSRVREEAGRAKESDSVLGESPTLDPNEAQRLLVHPLPHWVERMTTSYVESRGGRAQTQGAAWRLEWPDGAVTESAVFSGKDLVEHPTAVHLTTEQPRIRGLASHLPRCMAWPPRCEATGPCGASMRVAPSGPSGES